MSNNTNIMVIWNLKYKDSNYHESYSEVCDSDIDSDCDSDCFAIK